MNLTLFALAALCLFLFGWLLIAYDAFRKEQHKRRKAEALAAQWSELADTHRSTAVHYCNELIRAERAVACERNERIRWERAYARALPTSSN